MRNSNDSNIVHPTLHLTFVVYYNDTNILQSPLRFPAQILMPFDHDVADFCRAARAACRRPVTQVTRHQRRRRLHWAQNLISAVLGLEIDLHPLFHLIP